MHEDRRFERIQRNGYLLHKNEMDKIEIWFTQYEDEWVIYEVKEEIDGLSIRELIVGEGWKSFGKRIVL